MTTELFIIHAEILIYHPSHQFFRKIIRSPYPLSSVDIVTAAKNRDLEAVKLILSNNLKKIHDVDDSGYTALHWAGIRAHWEIFKHLIKYKPDVNAVGADGGTPVHWACHHDRPDMVKLIMDMGGDINIQNQWRRTPLHAAVRRGCIKVASLLLEKGAHPKLKTNEDWTPLLAKDTFFYKQEPWKVTFIRDENNRVYKLEVEFIRRKVSGIKSNY